MFRCKTSLVDADALGTSANLEGPGSAVPTKDTGVPVDGVTMVFIEALLRPVGFPQVKRVVVLRVSVFVVDLDGVGVTGAHGIDHAMSRIAFTVDVNHPDSVAITLVDLRPARRVVLGSVRASAAFDRIAKPGGAGGVSVEDFKSPLYGDRFGWRSFHLDVLAYLILPGITAWSPSNCPAGQVVQSPG